MSDEIVPTETMLMLRHPDPDAETLPMLTADEALALQTETAGHLIRAMTRLDDVIAAQTKRMDADVQAWQYEIGKLQARRDSWRASVLAWMERTGTEKLSTPWHTCFLKSGRKKKVVLDESKVIEVCQRVYPKAVELRPRIIKAEMDVAVDTFPKDFAGIVEEQQGETSLVIRRKSK